MAVAGWGWSVSVADASAEEGTDGTVEFEIRLNARDDCKAVKVDYATADGTATAGEDYTAASGTLTFEPGEKVKTISVPMLDGGGSGSGETFELRLSNALGVEIRNGEATGTIQNADDTAPTLSSASVDGDALTLTFNEALDGDSVPLVTSFSVTVAGSSRAIDAVSVSGSAVTLTLPSAVTSGEAVTSGYTVPTGAGAKPIKDTAGNAAATFANTQVTNETGALPVVSIAASATPVMEGTAAAYTLSRTGATDTALTVDVSVTESGAAVSGTAPTSVTFAESSATATLSVATEDDEVAEDSSTLTATVSSGTGYAVDGTSGSAEVVVNDDDAAPVVTTATPIEVAENATAVATLTATDADTAAEDLSWSIPAGEAGGADASKFSFTTAGVLTFKAAKDFESPDDANTDGDYEVTVRVTDGSNPVDAALVVRLTDVEDTGPTASFKSLPERHDGSAAFRFELHFSEAPSGLSYRTVGGGLLEVTGGTVTRARRLTRGSNQGWEVTIEPTHESDIVITLPARACGPTNAICMDGEPLARAATATIPGPASPSLPVVSIAPSTTPVTEGTAAAFTLTRTGATDAALAVTVSVTEIGSVLDGTPATSVTIEAGSDSATLSVATEDDEVSEDASTLRATVTSGAGYTVDGTSGSADVVVNDDDAAPVVTTASSIEVAENGTAVATLAATDADTNSENLSWSIPEGAVAGGDRSKFSLTTAGVLTFKAAKDFEAPDDANTDGDYEVTVRVTDGSNPVDAALVVRLTDMDEAAPTLSRASVDGDALKLAFNETLDEGSTPSASSFAVRVAGSSREVDAVSVSGEAVTLTLSSVVDSGEAVTVGYTAPTSSRGSSPKPVQDTAGNPAATFAKTKVRNETAALPVVSIAASTTPVTEGTAVPFTLTRTGSTDGALTVAVSVTESGGVLEDTPPSSVSFTPGSATATLSVATVDDDVFEDASTVTVTVTVTAGTGYTVDTDAGLASGVVESEDLEPITASFTRSASDHDGSNGFELHLEFSHEPATGFSYRTVHGALLDIAGGRITRVWRLESGKNRKWGIVVTPDGGDAVTLAARATTNCTATHAVCTADGRKLAGTLRLTVPGPASPSLPMVSIAPSTTPVTEGTAAAFTLTRTGATDAALAVTVSVTEIGSVLDGTPATSVTIEAGSDSATLSVATEDDEAAEDSSTLTATVTSGSGYTVSETSGSADVVVNDDDAAPVVTTASSIEVAENETAVATLAATDADTAAGDLSWSIPEGEAGGVDASKFSLTTAGVLTFKAAKDFAAPDDANTDGDYEVTVRVTDGSNPVDAALVVRLSALRQSTQAASDRVYTCGETGDNQSRCNDPEGVMITVSDAEVTEGPGATLDFVVTLSHAHSSAAVTMDYEILNSNIDNPYSDDVYAAVAGEDYTDVRGTLTIPQGETTGTISIAVLDDAVSEGLETLNLALSNASKATFVRNTIAQPGWVADGTIIPDEDTTAPTVTIRAADGVTAPVSGHFAVVLEFSEPVEGFDQSDVGVTNGTAARFVRTYYLNRWTATIVPDDGLDGNISIRVPAGAVTDRLGNSNHASNTFVVAARGASPNGLKPRLACKTPLEGNEHWPINVRAGFVGSGFYAPEGFDLHDIVLTTMDGRGAFGNHIFACQGGGRLRSCEILAEPQEGVSGTLAMRILAGAITDEAGRPSQASDPLYVAGDNWTVSVSDATATEGTNETIDFEVRLNARDDCKAVKVDYATADGTATAGEDYEAASGTLTFAPGETTKTINVALHDVTESDSEKTVTLQLSNVSGRAVELGSAEATGTIQGGGIEVPALSSASVDGAELALTFSKTLNESSTPPSSSFAVTVAGSARTVSSVVVSGSAVTLKLSSAVVSGETVTVGYTIPTGAGATPIKDTAGNAAATFASTQVANETRVLPVVSIVPSSTPVTEGTAAAFTLARTGATDAALTVMVSVSESGAVVSGTPPTSVTFAADSASATLSVATEDDEVSEDASTVTAAVSSGTGYTEDGIGRNAEVVVNDDDASPVVTTASPIEVAENETAVVTLAATDADTNSESLSWSIPEGEAGGGDRSKFSLTTAGVLTFHAEKDYEAPDDANTDGDYEVTVRVTDGSNPVDAALVVRLTDVDEVAPRLSSATVDGDVLKLTFNEALDTDSVPPKTSFTATVAGSSREVDAVSVAGEAVTLTLSSAVDSGEAVTVGYTAPTRSRGASAKPVQDTAGNPAATFANTKVKNETAALPVVSIAASTTPVTEGTAAAFTLTRTGATDAALAVTVSMTETGSVLDGTPATSVTIEAGSDSATLSVATEDDEAVEDSSTVTATVSPGTDYTVDGTSGSADVVVNDDDAAPVVTTATPIAVVENETAVATLAATDADTPAGDLSWSIPEGEDGGADAAKFSLTAEGALTFRAAKDFEAPDDANTDGDYEVTVRVTDGANPVDVALVVQLEDVDDAAPALSSASVDGDALKLTFNEALDEGSVPPASAFAVTVAGSARTVGSVAVSESAVTLSLSSAVVSGETVTVGYTVPTGADTQPVKDTAGNAAATFASTQVTNETVGLPVVSIAAASTAVTEGTAAAFTLTRTGATDAALTVAVSVSQAGSMMSGGAPTEAVFAANAAQARISVSTDDDDEDEPDAQITASIAATSAFNVDEGARSARVDVFDNDEPGPASVEIWSSTLTWTDFGNGWLIANAEDFSDPDWSENGRDYQIWYIAYGPSAREFWVAHNGAGGDISEPGQLVLHVGGVTIDSDDVMSAFGQDQIGVARGIEQDWEVGEQVRVRLTRADGASEATPAGPGLSVADARVNESAGVPLRFRVMLAERSDSVVSVRYRTSDGTAQAGSDYVSAHGVVRFAPGETEKTVEVAVLQDDHDEGSETMTLTLSSPFGATIADGTATGTISNTGAIPKAWIARFGRTVAAHVLDAVEARREAAPTPGMEASLAGQRIGGAAFPENTADRQERGRGLSDWLKGETDPQRKNLGSRTVTERDLLTGSSFALTAQTKGSGLISMWGRGAVTRFSGRDGDLTVDGEVASGMLGADWTQDAWKTGLLVSHSLGDGSYRGASAGTVTSTLTGIFPWVSHDLSEHLSVWGVAGYGEGSLTVEPEEQPKIRTDLDLWMAAAGLRGVIVDGGDDGLTLAAETDAMIVQTSSDAVSGSGGNLEAAEAEVTRLRLGLEGSQPLTLAKGATLTPSVEIGVRHDGGDAETGFGVDIGGGLAWSDTIRGITAEFRGRGLLTHEADGFRERGLSGSLSWDPTPASDRGPRASLTQTLGGSASGGMDELLSRDTLTGLAANDNGNDLQQRRLEARFGYGFAAFGDRFTSSPEISVGLSNTGRDYSLGWRLVRGGGGFGGGSFELSVEAQRREAANDDIAPEHQVGFRVNARF